MSWGSCYFYYSCPACGKRYKYSIDLIPVLGESFGKCPVCGIFPTPEKEGAVTSDDLMYEEIED